METFPVTFALLLAFATLGSTQMLGGPGTEPWNFAIMAACQSKGVNSLQTTMATAQQCVGGLSSGNPLGICSKKKERNECLKPYYDEIKKCFSTDEQKMQVDKAFKAQKEGVNYFCEDNAKLFKGITQEDQCQPSQDQTCTQNAMKSAMPDMSKLFAENNCKMMHAMAKCSKASFENCKTSVMGDFMYGQMNAILGATPCGEANGVSSSLSAVVTPVLLFCLLCHGVMKALF